ncbi:MAG: hypothetical protein IJ716_00330 [Lachnospiraceae bacterium]|nr:hypothetical protein [Lachnospiraceae bacterium]
MKKKNLIVITALSASCVAVLAAVFVLTREPKDEFAPAAADTAPSAATWTDISEPEVSVPYTKPETSTQVKGSTADQTQTVVTENENGSTTSLSDSTTKEEAAAEKPADKPKTEDDTTDKNNKPDYGGNKPSDNKPGDAGNQDSTPPAGNPGGNSGHEGQVYDPVFGWVTPGRTVQDTIDSDGDINKQIGSMGGN